MDPRPDMDVPHSAPTDVDRRHRPIAHQPDGSRDTPPPVLSFVIPAFNEEQFITRTIEAIHALVPPLSYEVIVVDNGSTDATPRIASDLRATVIHQSGGTIGSLRNQGVSSARGEIVVFLDADVVLTPEWAARIPASVELLTAEPRTVTGSMCGVPEDASWLERSWFAPRGRKSTHVGSGHMLIPRRFFNELSGFDESLATGEDYHLSQQALARGGRIASDRRLKVVHLGFPRSIASFVQREAWHGVGDYRSVSTFLRSKVAIAAAVFALLHVLLVVSLLAGTLWLALAAAAGIVSLCVLSSYRQYRAQEFALILINAGVFWLYYLGRTLAFFRRILGRHSRGSRSG
jgi:glycosyltransferase involved in cell wall biosynthesis